MEQKNQQRNVKNLCPSCLVKLSLIQGQLSKLESLLSSLKATLNFREACLYTGLSRSQLYKLTQSNRIPHHKPTGRMLFFNKQELDEWLCQNPEGLQAEESQEPEGSKSENNEAEKNITSLKFATL